MGHTFSFASGQTVANLWEAIKRSPPNLVLLDIMLPAERPGFELIADIRTRIPDAVIVMHSCFSDAAMITRCLDYGADDFLAKGCPKEEIGLRLIHTWLRRKTSSPTIQCPYAVGKTMRLATDQLSRLLNSAVSAVHVQGESGTGKEVISQIIQWAIKPRPMIKINCGSVAPSLIASELFGHRKGAFTGADHDREGYIAQADGGWLFLDEVSCLNTDMQATLLRFLENREIVRVGDSIPRKVDVNILSASNVPIHELVAKGLFRLDLWQRLQEMEITLPPLRARPKEIPELVHYFLRSMKGGPYRVSAEALTVLTQCTWENGNVRELRNCLRAMSMHHINGLLTPSSIPQRIWQQNLVSQAGEHGDPDVKLKNISFPQGKSCVSWEKMSHLLLLACVKKNFHQHGTTSVRNFAHTFGLSSSTASRRLRQLVDKRLVTAHQLSSWVSITN